MSKTLEILKQAEYFLKLSEDDNFATGKKHLEMMERSKKNPNDPDYQKYLVDRREQYDVNQQVLDTNSEALNAYLDKLKERQQKFIEKLKQEPNKFEEFRDKKRSEDRARLESARKGQNLESKVLLFGRAVAFKRSDEKKKNNKKPFPEYESIKQKLDNLTDYLNKIRIFMYGPKEKRLMANLEFLVTDGASKVREIRHLFPALSRDLLEIVTILDTQLSQHKAQGLVT